MSISASDGPFFFFFNLQLKYFGWWAGLIFGKCIALILLNVFGIEY